MVSKQKRSGNNGGGAKKIEIDYVEAERLGGLGLTNEQIWLCLGFTETTFYDRTRTDTEFAAAISSGKAKGIAKIAGKLVEKAEMRSEPSMMFYLKCQGKWREKDAEQPGVNLNVNVDQQDLSPSDSDLIARAVKRLMRED